MGGRQLIWSHSQRACLAEMGFRHWHVRAVSGPATVTEPLAEPVWLWPAVAQDGAAGLVFVMQTAQPSNPARRLLSDMARHFALALPGSPQPFAAEAPLGTTLVVGFADAGPQLNGQLTLPSLQALLSAEPEPRRQCWRQLSALIAQHIPGGGQ